MAGNENSGRGNGSKTQVHIASLAREHSVDAIKKLVTVMVTGDNADATRAAAILLDRGWGKAPQEINLGNAEGSKGVKLLVEVIDATKPLPAATGSQSQEPPAADKRATVEHADAAT